MWDERVSVIFSNCIPIHGLMVNRDNISTVDIPLAVGFFCKADFHFDKYNSAGGGIGASWIKVDYIVDICGSVRGDDPDLF